MSDYPFTFTIPMPSAVPSGESNHIQRRLSAMKGQFLDQQAYDQMLAVEDTLVYEVYEIPRPHQAGELLSGISIVHPGKVGNEYFMTKGHFHQVLDTAEVYYCLKGEGYMVMEDPEGNAQVAPLAPGVVLYVPPRWGHRSVCTGRQQDLVTFYVYPGNAGHDYGTIETQGFRKLVVEGAHGVEIVDNPRWKR
ncbi:MAG: glucose-6-phosphate isomerase [Anaerolineae bacterium]|nr:glucose-6-phosphate isomerase [Anaerolineae bacterium]